MSAFTDLVEAGRSEYRGRIGQLRAARRQVVRMKEESAEAGPAGRDP